MKVRVFDQHTHNGITYPANSVLDLPDDAAQWLLDSEKARREGIVVVTERLRSARAALDAEDAE